MHISRALQSRRSSASPRRQRVHHGGRGRDRPATPVRAAPRPRLPRALRSLTVAAAFRSQIRAELRNHSPSLHRLPALPRNQLSPHVARIDLSGSVRRTERPRLLGCHALARNPRASARTNDTRPGRFLRHPISVFSAKIARAARAGTRRRRAKRRVSRPRRPCGRGSTRRRLDKSTWRLRPAGDREYRRRAHERLHQHFAVHGASPRGGRAPKQARAQGRDGAQGPIRGGSRSCKPQGHCTAKPG